MYASLRGSRIFFDIEGPLLAPRGGELVERPVVFLLHGGPGGDHATMRALAPLAEVAQLVYIDHRGSGRSLPCDPATCTLEENIADVEALRQHLGLERITVLGGSYGGMVAQGYAIAHPDRVANLILVVTAPSYRFIDDAREFVEQRGTPDQKRVCQRLWDANFESLEQLKEFYRLMGPLYSRTFSLDRLEENWGQGRRNFHQLNLGFSTFLKSFDFTPRLRTIPCPTLVLAGAHDWICAPRHSQIIAREIPRAQLKIFAESSHSIWSDEPDAFFTAVRGFLTYAAP